VLIRRNSRRRGPRKLDEVRLVRSVGGRLVVLALGSWALDTWEGVAAARQARGLVKVVSRLDHGHTVPLSVLFSETTLARRSV